MPSVNSWAGSLDGVVRSATSRDPEVERPFLSHSEDATSSPHHPEEQHAKAKSCSKLLIVSALATTLGTVIPGGYNIGILNSPQQIIVAFCNASVLHHYGVQLEDTPLELLWSFVVSIFLIGGGVGALMGGPIANRVGRKNALLLNSALNLVASIFFGTCGLAQSVEMLLIGRLMVGLGAGMATSFMPMYMAEIATPAVKNVLGLLCPIGINFGLLIGQILGMQSLLGNEDYWNILLALTSVPVLICLALWPFIPESPRYLFNKQQDEKAIRELCRLRDAAVKELEREIELFRNVALPDSNDDETPTGSGWNLRTIWAKRSLRWPFICVIVMHIGNQLSGINAVFYYSTDIFQSAGLDKQQAEFALLGAGFVNCMMSGSVAFTTGRFGRRPLMLTSTVGVSSFLMVLTVTILYINEVTWVSYCCICALMLYIIFFALGMGSLPFYLPTELIPAGPQPMVMSVGCMINWSFNFAVGMTFPSLQSLMGVYVFLIFAVTTSIQAVFLYFRLPETFQRQTSTNTAIH